MARRVPVASSFKLHRPAVTLMDKHSGLRNKDTSYFLSRFLRRVLVSLSSWRDLICHFLVSTVFKDKILPGSAFSLVSGDGF